MARPPNPKMRITGAVLLVLAVCALVGTITGADTQGSTAERIVLGVFGAILAIIGFALVRTRTPVVRTLRAEPHGLVIGLGDQPPFTLAWDRLDAVSIATLSPVFGGHTLILSCSTPPPKGPLRIFERRQGDGSVKICIGLDRAQGQDLLAHLPANCPCYDRRAAQSGNDTGSTRHP